ncbi:RNA pseudouridine synthase [Chitinibacter tainanensis]|uniref:RNA pseudouridine synthase n=1 Tax=Chitinibacter tainanensis TaxID=230667 RepID=UPI002357E70F|nr:RNA pseudouridine synthase [Chitinibacter tainanensis]
MKKSADKQPASPRSPRKPTASAAKPSRAKPAKAADAFKPAGGEAVRLAKRMAELGLCSRSQADRLIEAGRVEVDGQVVTTLGSRVFAEQHINLLPIDLERLANQPEKISILWHKPAGVDGWEVADFLAIFAERSRSPDDQTGYAYLQRHRQGLLLPLGLDREASGLLVLTQDRRLAQTLKQYRDFEQEYLLQLRAPATAAQLAQMNALKEFDGEPMKGWKVTQQNEQQLRLVLRANSPYLVPDWCEAGEVEGGNYKRLRIGRLALGGLAEGQWRYLHADERF